MFLCQIAMPETYKEVACSGCGKVIKKGEIYLRYAGWPALLRMPARNATQVVGLDYYIYSEACLDYMFDDMRKKLAIRFREYGRGNKLGAKEKK